MMKFRRISFKELTPTHLSTGFSPLNAALRPSLGKNCRSQGRTDWMTLTKTPCIREKFTPQKATKFPLIHCVIAYTRNVGPRTAILTLFGEFILLKRMALGQQQQLANF